ncbi:MAG TPA: hypothetical protein VKB78_06760, partial [Pirellulales bacterium]|nr:hypothetical protein [Pirellulales bacterium]
GILSIFAATSCYVSHPATSRSHDRWFLTYGVDGFLIQPPYLPGGLDGFVDQVMPELQEHGLFETE